jgi:Zn-dependent M28 family amino/carboxypeptidase
MAVMLAGLATVATSATSAGCSSEAVSEQSAALQASPGVDAYQDIYNSVDQHHLQTLLKDMCGVNPVTAAGETFSITDRYLPQSKANYRTYWTSYFQTLGLEVTPLSFTTTSGLEAEGHNLEAVLPGKVADTVVVIVHYDSIGPSGPDNPGADDDMTGMSILMETARILAAYRGRLHYTVRFVAADYEEWGGLEGARSYAKYIQQLSAQQHFRIVSALDDEQSGWKEGSSTLDIFDHDCEGGQSPDSSALSTMLVNTATQYSQLTTQNGCMGPNSDFYAMWEIGVPAVVYGEHDPFNNPHFDRNGGDTYDLIAQDYFFQIAQVVVAFSARVVGIDP